eukprot:gene2551-2924_t
MNIEILTHMMTTESNALFQSLVILYETSFVVFVVSLCVSIISNTPVVFLNLAEVSAGQIDMVITPGTWTGSTQLNYTLMSSLLEDDISETYHTPRLISNDVYITGASACPAGDTTSNAWKYSGSNCDPIACFGQVCAQTTMYKGQINIIDSAREKRMGLGRDWTLPEPSAGSVYIQSKLADALDVAAGDYVYIELYGLEVLGAIWKNSNASAEAIPYIYLTARVEHVFSSSQGKFDSSINNAIIMDYETFLPFLVTQLDPSLPPAVTNYIAAQNFYEFAQSAIINLPPSRLAPYTQSNQDTILKEIIKFSSRILYKIGFNQLDPWLPVMNELSDNRFVALFLGLILNVIIFILLFLSILLIYSLLMIDVETRTFEMGVMRMIGTTRAGIVQLMLCKAFSYSLPSWALGLLTAQLFGLGVSAWFRNVTGVPIPTRLTVEAVLLSTALGIIIPVAASLLPIRSALGRNLHDSLDVKHSKTMAVQISIERSEDSSFSSSVAIIGLILSAFGFGIYYIFPLSLVSFNLSLLLNMFFLLIIGMLLGLVMLALNVEHLLERLIVRVVLFWEAKAIPAIVLKNLVAHKLRNRKTAIMYAVSLAFIIFVNVSYATQQASMNYKVQQSYGAYLRVDTPHSFKREEAALIENFLATSSHVESFAWSSTSFSRISPSGAWQPTVISNIGHIYSDNVNMYALSPNFFATAIDGFLKVSDIVHDPDYVMDPAYTGLSEQIYSQKSAPNVVIGALYVDKIGASMTSNFILKPSIQGTDTKINATSYLTRATAFLDSAPSFTFSKFPSVTGQDALISLPSYLARAGPMFGSVREVPLQKVIIRVKGSVSALKGELANLLDAVPTLDYSIRDYAAKIEPNETAATIIQYFFSFTTVIAMLISFFSLMSSMFTNIFEQSKEIGVLRAIGIPRSWMIRIYIYESFVLVFASSLLGVIIGSIVGWTMILQRVLFTQLPIPFVFPWLLLLIIFVCSIVFSFISAFGPIRKVLNQEVVAIMRIVT